MCWFADWVTLLSARCKYKIIVLMFHGLVNNSYILHFGNNEPPSDYPTTFAIQKSYYTLTNQHQNSTKKQNYTQSWPSNHFHYNMFPSHKVCSPLHKGAFCNSAYSDMSVSVHKRNERRGACFPIPAGKCSYRSWNSDTIRSFLFLSNSLFTNNRRVWRCTMRDTGRGTE